MTDFEASPSRRDRLRAATMKEITATAHRLLVEQGPDAVSLRAIAREMGMTAPGLYRYFPSRDELLRHVIAGIFRELSGGVRRAIDEAAPPLATGTGDRRVKMASKLIAACREFRRWALSHKGEFTLLFGVPLPGLHYDASGDIAEQCAMEFAGTFYTLFVELWSAAPFPILAADEIDPVLGPQLGKFRDKFAVVIPEGAILVYLRCWVLLYGAVALEVFGHLDFALDDSAPMFELTLSELAAKVGLQYPPAG
jgi:AcrR family transcriptional regulator